MQQIDSERSHGGHWSPTRPHQCDNVPNEGQIMLACGCMLPVVAGQNMLKDWLLQMTLCCKGQVNDIVTMVMRDTGSTICVVIVFVLFKINSSPSAFYIIKPTCIVIGF